MKTVLVVAFLGLWQLCATTPCVAGEVTPQARDMIALIDALDVESHWPAGQHVHWESGVPDGKPETGAGRHTHCSAFVASAAKKLGIYILRPPEHAQLLLANAQFEWLATQGAQNGWQSVEDAVDAQHFANSGYFVVAAYRNHHDDKPGHIAIVRPSGKSAAAIRSEGPDITQAGNSNYRDTTLQRGFAGHPAAWGRKEVRFYAHAVEAAAARR